MHRTEGEDYKLVGGKRLYQPANPPINAATRLPAEAMNAIQEEICTVIENAGLSLAVGSSSDTWGQLWEALTASKILGSEALTDNQVYKNFLGGFDLDANNLVTTGAYYINYPISNFPAMEENPTTYSGWLHVHRGTDTDELPFITQTMRITKYVAFSSDFAIDRVYIRKYQKLDGVHTWGAWVRQDTYTGIVNYPSATEVNLDILKTPGAYYFSNFTNGPVSDGVGINVLVFGNDNMTTQVVLSQYNGSTHVGTPTFYIRHIYYSLDPTYTATAWTRVFTGGDVIPEANIDPVFAGRSDGTATTLSSTSTVVAAKNMIYLLADGVTTTVTVGTLVAGDACWFNPSSAASTTAQCLVTFPNYAGAEETVTIKTCDALSVPLNYISKSGLQLIRAGSGFIYVGGGVRIAD